MAETVATHPVASQALAQGATAGAVGAAQTGDVRGGIVPGVISGGVPLVGAAAQKAAPGISNFILGQTIRPSAKLRADIGPGGKPLGTRGVAEAIRSTRATTSEQAQKALDSAYSSVDGILKRSEQAGKTVDAGVAAHAPLVQAGGEPGLFLRAHDARRGLGMEPDVTPFLARIEEMAKQGHISLPKANTLKREAQRLAYEHRQRTESLDELFNKDLAKALRELIEEAAGPEVKAANQKVQQAIWAKEALGSAEDRPVGLVSGLGGAGAAVGGTLTGNLPVAAGGALMALREWPRAGARIGISVDDIGALMGRASRQPAALAPINAGLTTRQQLEAELAKRSSH